ncbi:MAG: T9SS type A sorting domain-containing protein [Ignavibacteria bacterium]|nr:T9SS type A sorting domain-containing protein [Ignavibacteria bacterium]
MKHILWLLVFSGLLNSAFSQPAVYNFLLDYKNNSGVISLPVDSIQEISFQNYSGILRITKADTSQVISIPADSITNIAFQSGTPALMLITKKNSGGTVSLPLDSVYQMSLQAVSGVNEPKTITAHASGYELAQNYPNPFNPFTNIVFSMPRAGNVKLTVSNLLGQAVQVLVDGFVSGGVHRVQFDGSNIPSGVYFYTLIVQSDGGNSAYKSVKKLVLMK